MKKTPIWILFAALSFSLWGCGLGITRQETDIYTITDRDTTTLFYVQNAPGNRDNGVIYPSSRTFESKRYLAKHDSTVDRFYPDFIRLGAFESVGLALAGDRNHSIGTGLFGIFQDFNKDYARSRGDSSSVFPGGIYRFGIGEWRLRWFRDAKNWTFGTSVIETIFPDSRFEKALISIMPIYLRKRYFLSEDIPYVAITPSLGIGYYPSQYINLSASLDVGSISGLNVRAYVGLAAGSNSKSSFQVRESEFTDEAQTSIFPYAGLGISFLDFLNIVPETYIEWKDHPHSGWEIGIAQLFMVASGSEFTAFSDTLQSSLFNGFVVRIANASVALPIEALGYKLYAGTSLANMLILGQNDWGIGILPIRLGFWQTLIPDDLILEPFAEYNYYPSSFVHIGAKINLRLTDQLNIGFVAGYASGNTSNGIGSTFTKNFGSPGSFSTGYLGVSIGLMDKLFNSGDLRYNKKIDYNNQ